MLNRVRYVPPVQSPLTIRALLGGFGGFPSDAAAIVRGSLDEVQPGTAVALLDSGTSALQVALQLARPAAPGPVAIPAFACYDIATAVLGAGCDFTFYDLDPRTLAPDAGSLQSALKAGARTVVLVHLYGVPALHPEVAAVLREAQALIIDDAAQGVGARNAGSPLGVAGALGVLSFGRGKGRTGGSGGALIAPPSSPLRERIGSLGLGTAESGALVAFGKGAAQWLLARPALYGIPASLPFLGLGETHFRAPHEPRAMSQHALRVLARTLPLASAETVRRQANAARLLRALAGRDVAAPQIGTGATPGWLRLPTLVPDRYREAWRSSEARRLGIYQSYPTALPNLPNFGTRAVSREASYAGAEELARGLFTVPTHGLLSESDLQRLERWLLRYSSPS